MCFIFRSRKPQLNNLVGLGRSTREVNSKRKDASHSAPQIRRAASSKPPPRFELDVGPWPAPQGADRCAPALGGLGPRLEVKRKGRSEGQQPTHTHKYIFIYIYIHIYIYIFFQYIHTYIYIYIYMYIHIAALDSKKSRQFLSFSELLRRAANSPSRPCNSHEALAPLLGLLEGVCEVTAQRLGIASIVEGG